MTMTPTSNIVDSSPVKSHDPPGLGPANPVYANVTTVSLGPTTTLFTVAGQVATRPDGSIPVGKTTTETVLLQMDLCLSKFEACLAAVGAEISNLTRLIYYFSEAAYDLEESRNLIIEKMKVWLRGSRPASCLLVVKSLSKREFMCEFEGMGVVNK